MKVLAINCPQLDLSYFSSRGLNIDVTYIKDTTDFSLVHFKDADDGTGHVVPFYTPWAGNYLEQNYKSFDYSIIIVGWDPKDYNSLAANTGGYTNPNPLTSGTFWSTVRLDGNENAYVVHEINHGLVGILNVNFKLNHSTPTTVRDWMDVDQYNRPYFENNNPNAPDGNFYQTWQQIVPHLDLLKSITYNKAMTYKYFKDSEIVGLKPELVQKLDQARGIAGIPFVITSGFRTVAQNTTAGGVPDSAHLTGEAVDIACTDSIKRLSMVKSLLQVGFNRLEVCPNHIHCDISITLPQNVMVLSQNG